MPPQLDHYHGRTCTQVLNYADEAWEWAIELEGGVQIQNLDARRTKPPEEVVGLGFALVAMEETQTTMRFTPLKPVYEADEIWNVVFTPTKYQIVEPGQEPYLPQFNVEEQAVIADMVGEPVVAEELRARGKAAEVSDDAE